jgi:hypothetical protein
MHCGATVFRRNQVASLEARALLNARLMSIAKMPSKNLTQPDDAARARRTPHVDEEPAVRETSPTDTAPHDALDSSNEDPYDNVACTD